MNIPVPGVSRRTRRLASGVMGTDGWVQDRRGALLLGLMVWVLLTYLSVSVYSLTASLPTESDMAEPSPFARFLKLALLGVSAIIVLWRGSLALLVLRTLNRFFVAFIVLVPLSAVWSVNPPATIARFISLMSIVLVSYAFVLMSWHRARFQDVVRPIITLVLLASFVFALVNPEWGIEAGEGTLKEAWRGITVQKNTLGQIASIGVLLWLHALLNREVRWWICLSGIALAGSLVLLSRSSTSLLSTTLTVAFMLLMLRAPANIRRFMPYIIGSFSVVVVVYALAVLNLIPGIGILLSPIAEMTGKDLSFSNRAEIWAIVKEHVQLAPFLGSGYGAYWTGAIPSSPSYVFMVRMYFYPSESHNGYLEIVNDLGFLGLIVLLGYLTTFVRQSIRLMQQDRAQGVLFICVFFQQAVTNLSESTWLAINSAFGIALMTVATFSLARCLLDLQLRQVFGTGSPAPMPDAGA